MGQAISIAIKIKQSERKASAEAGTVPGVVVVGCRRSQKKEHVKTDFVDSSAPRTSLGYLLGLLSLLLLSRLAKFLSNS